MDPDPEREERAEKLIDRDVADIWESLPEAPPLRYGATIRMVSEAEEE